MLENLLAFYEKIVYTFLENGHPRLFWEGTSVHYILSGNFITKETGYTAQLAPAKHIFVMIQ
jgi:hypothetical protein